MWARTAVLFPADTSAFTSVTYTVPAGVNRQLITGLAAGGKYTVTQTTSTAGITVNVAQGGTSKADASGVLAIGFPASVHPVLTAVRDAVKYTQPSLAGVGSERSPATNFLTWVWGGASRFSGKKEQCRGRRCI